MSESQVAKDIVFSSSRPWIVASQYVRVPAFARFEAMLNRLEKASALTYRCNRASMSRVTSATPFSLK